MKLYMYMCVLFHVFQCQRNKNTIKVNIHHTKILVLIYIENLSALNNSTCHFINLENIPFTFKAQCLFMVCHEKEQQFIKYINSILCTKPAADSYFNSIDFELSSLSMTKTSECL